MRFLILLPLVISIATINVSSSASTDKVVCYWGTWSGYRWGNGKFSIDNVNPQFCTHLIYGFVGIVTDGSVRLLDEYLDVDLQNLKKFNDLKQQNPNVKTLIAIGGWNEGSENYSLVASKQETRAVFINSALTLVQKWGFDGFDLDWEYPGQRGGAPEDIQNFVSLIKEFREEFDKHGLLLTAAVAAAASSVDLSYDVPALSKYLDFINVMTYDLHGSWETVTGQNAPLYASSVDVDASQKLLNVDAAIRGWIERGAAPEKLILGVGFYGRSFTLSSSSNTHLGAAASGGGTAGKYTSESGFVGYHEIIELQNDGGWTVVWDDEQKTPYMFKGNQWIGYDNPESLTYKVNYAKTSKLGGIMVWSIDTDDFNGLSGTKYQLLAAIDNALKGENTEPQPEPETTPKPAPTEKPTEAPTEKPTEAPTQAPDIKTTENSETELTKEPETNPTTAASSNEESDPTTTICVKEGYVRDPNDCTVFYYCFASGSGFNVIKRQCNHGLVYDVEANICNYASAVQC